MNAKRLTALLLVFVLAFTLFGCTKTKENTKKADKTTEAAADERKPADQTEPDTTKAPEEPDEERSLTATADINDYITTTDVRPPFWKVTDPETGHVMYLLGTMHILPKAVTGYPDEIMDAYAGARSIAVEYDVLSLVSDMKAMQAFTQELTYSDGTTVKDHLTPENYEAAKACLSEMGYYSPLFDVYTVGYWVDLVSTSVLGRIENLELDGTDTYFINLAKKDGKSVINIEQLEAQTGALNAYTDDLANYVLAESVEEVYYIQSYTKSLAEVYEDWANGNGEINDESELDDLPDDLRDDYDLYEDAVLNDRNEVMAKRAAEIITNEDGCLFMVGAAHYAGENGVDNQLEKMGFTVEKIF